MTLFRYRVLESDGSTRQGLTEAADADALARELQRQGALVLKVETAGLSWRGWRPDRGLGAEALASVTGQLATLLTAGLTLERALGVLIGQPGKRQLRAQAVLARIRERVKGGLSLSAALAQEQGLFAGLYLSLVQAGEAGGALPQSLQQLSEYLERSQALRGEIINALIYPAFLVAGVLGSLALLLAYVVPQFVPIFQDLGVPIPWMTGFILGLGEFINRFGLLMLAVLIMTGLLVAHLMGKPAWRLRRDRRLLTWPVLGPLWQRIEAARLARTLGTLLQNGVPLLAALKIVADGASNRAIRARLRVAIESVKSGGALATALSDDGLLPDLALQMIRVGEEAGRLDDMLLKVAQVFDAEARRSIARLLAALVPTLTIVMAVMVAFIMLAIMLPLMSLTANI